MARRCRAVRATSWARGSVVRIHPRGALAGFTVTADAGAGGGCASVMLTPGSWPSSTVAHSDVRSEGRAPIAASTGSTRLSRSKRFPPRCHEVTTKRRCGEGRSVRPQPRTASRHPASPRERRTGSPATKTISLSGSTSRAASLRCRGRRLHWRHVERRREYEVVRQDLVDDRPPDAVEVTLGEDGDLLPLSK